MIRELVGLIVLLNNEDLQKTPIKCRVIHVRINDDYIDKGESPFVSVNLEPLEEIPEIDYCLLEDVCLDSIEVCL